MTISIVVLALIVAVIDVSLWTALIVWLVARRFDRPLDAAFANWGRAVDRDDAEACAYYNVLVLRLLIARVAFTGRWAPWLVSADEREWDERNRREEPDAVLAWRKEWADKYRGTGWEEPCM